MTTTMEGISMNQQQELFGAEEVGEEKSLLGQDGIVEATFNDERVPQLDLTIKEGQVVSKGEYREDVEEEESAEELIRLSDGHSYSLEEWTSPVFEDGPTREMVESWKQKFGRIYMVPFDFGTFIIRGLTRTEYRSIQETRAAQTESNEQEPLETRLSRKFDNEELISAICTLWPQEAQTEEYFIEKAPAGATGTLAEMIYDKSAFRALTPPIAL